MSPNQRHAQAAHVKLARTEAELRVYDIGKMLGEEFLPDRAAHVARCAEAQRGVLVLRQLEREANSDG